MTQVSPVDLEAAVVIQVQHLVHDGVLHMLLVHEPILAQYHRADFVAESTRTRRLAGRANKIRI